MSCRSLLQIACLLAFTSIARAAYTPAEYPQTPPRLERILLTSPPEARAGDTLSVDITARPVGTWVGAIRIFIHFLHDRKVLHVALAGDVGSSGAHEMALGAGGRLAPLRIPLPDWLPAGDYEVTAGAYLEKPVATTKLRIASKATGSPLIVNTGTFTDKSGVPHRWHVNHAHTLFWDGVPFIPVGGMLIPSDNFDTFKAQVDLLVRYGVRDVYFNVGSSVQMPRVWENKSDDRMRLFQQCVDYMDEVGMRYGMEPSGLQAHGFAYDLMGGGDWDITVGADGAARLDKAGDDQWVKEGKLYAGGRKLRDPLYVISRRPGGDVAAHGRGQIVHDNRPGEGGKPKSDEHQAVVIDLAKLSPGAYRVHLCVARYRDGWNDNMYYWSEDTEKYFQKIRDLYGRIRMGPGFRFIADAFWNENNFNHGFVPSDRNFRAAHRDWLSKRYGTIERLRIAWAVDGESAIPDFTAAGNLVPIRGIDEAATKRNWAYLVDAETGSLVRCREGISQYRYDLLESIARQVRDYHIRVADLFKTLHDVPVIFKNFSGMDFWHINDAGIAGGFDGLGMESYGIGEPMLTFMGIPSFGEVEQATKTMWLIATEIGEGNHQDQCLSRNKLFGCTSRHGTCYPIYASLLSGGAKGLYHYYLMPTGADKFWEDAMSRDPRQLEWLGTFARIAANAPAIVDYKPTAYYRFPGLFQPNSGLTYSDPHREYFNTDTLWFVDPAGKLPNGVWMLPTFTLRVPTEMMFINIENAPASLRYADEVNAFVKSGRRVTWLGYRKDRGTFPQIDRYYTGDFAKNDDGIEIQVLAPTPASRVIARNKAGQVWNLIEGNLQIISKNAEVQPGWRPDQVELGKGTHRWDLKTFMRDVLGVQEIALGADLEAFEYGDANDRVTVVSLRPEIGNVVQLGPDLPPYTLDATSNVLPPTSSKQTITVNGAVTASWPDGAPLSATDRITLEPDALTLIKSNGKYKWAPEGMLLDTTQSRSSVLIRSARSAPPPRIASKAQVQPAAPAPGSILIEAERPIASNFNLDTFSALTELSGDTMLGLASRNTPPAPDGYCASYDFDVKQPGTYQLWVREGYLAMASPARWRIDGGEWQKAPNTLVPQDIRLVTLYNAVEDERMIFAWYHYGKVQLSAGTHRLSYSVTEKRPAGLDIGLANGNPYGKLLDCFVLSQGEFKPAGRRIETAHISAGEQPAAPRVNLVENPSLEQESGGWSAFEKDGDAWKPVELKKDRDWEQDFWWTRRVGAEGKIAVRELMDIGGLQVRQSFCGVRSLRLRSGKAARRFSSRPMPIRERSSIAFGGYLRSEGAMDSFGLRVRFLDSSGKELTGASAGPTKASPHWQLVESPRMTAPAGAETAVLDCTIPPGERGIAWFDDVYLFENVTHAVSN